MKKKKPADELRELSETANSLQKEYNEKIETEVQYSLKVDPLDKYKMPIEQKNFIEQFVQYKSIATAAEFCGIPLDKAKEYYLAYSSQVEIRRINLALYHRQFSTRLATLDELGGYLTSLLTDDNVVYADRLKTPDKLKVVQMLIDLNKMKIDSLSDPKIIMEKDIDIQIKNLSLSTIKSLLSETTKPKTYTISDQPEPLSPEENAYLNTLPTEDLLKLIEETNGGDN